MAAGVHASVLARLGNMGGRFGHFRPSQAIFHDFMCHSTDTWDGTGT